MSVRVNPIILLGLIVALILSLGIFASAQLAGGGTAGDALSVGEAQVGKPFVMATDGPNSFSCTGLMRYILRTTGVDGNAPWVPEAYLSTYAPVDLRNLQPGDIVIFPGWATMYAGNGMLLNANEVVGYVTNTPMSFAGTPLGAVRPPYAAGTEPVSGASDPTVATNPVPATDTAPATDPTLATDPMGASDTELTTADPMLATDPVATEPMTMDDSTIETESTMMSADLTMAADPLTEPEGSVD